MEDGVDQGIIEILKNEHQEILRFTKDLRKQCLRFMEYDEILMENFRQNVEFIRSFEDKRHYQKEEKILFAAMAENLGLAAVKLVRNGMMVEHDLARLAVNNLEQALNHYEKQKDSESKLDILTSATSYCRLLERHSEKENQVVFPFAQRGLSTETMKKLDEAAVEYERAFIKMHGI